MASRHKCFVYHFCEQQQRVSPTCHGPAQLCVLHVVVAPLTTQDEARYGLKIAFFAFCQPHLHSKPRYGAPLLIRILP